MEARQSRHKTENHGWGMTKYLVLLRDPVARVPFGDLRIGPLARKRVMEALDSNWISEGRFVWEFEEKFAEKFRWTHAIACSSGTDAGMVVWSAVREMAGEEGNEGSVITPACAFVATANCLLAAGLKPYFRDIELPTLNLDPSPLNDKQTVLDRESGTLGIQFVATMGKPTPLEDVCRIARDYDLCCVADLCEAHGAMHPTRDGSHPLTPSGIRHAPDAAIYSFYAAHLIVGGEGGIICTDDDELAALCCSIKSHGRPPGSNYFDFQRPGFNSKWNELCAAVALESLEKFDETFEKRRMVRQKLLDALSPFEDRIILYRDAPGEVIAPHAFPIVLRDETGDIRPLYRALEDAGVQCKSLFGSLPTDHKAFEFLGHKRGDFPVAERIGRTGLHFGCNEFMTDEDVDYIAEIFARHFIDTPFCKGSE